MRTSTQHRGAVSFTGQRSFYWTSRPSVSTRGAAIDLRHARRAATQQRVSLVLTTHAPRERRHAARGSGHHRSSGQAIAAGTLPELVDQRWPSPAASPWARRAGQRCGCRARSDRVEVDQADPRVLRRAHAGRRDRTAAAARPRPAGGSSVEDVEVRGPSLQPCPSTSRRELRNDLHTLKLAGSNLRRDRVASAHVHAADRVLFDLCLGVEGRARALPRIGVAVVDEDHSELSQVLDGLAKETGLRVRVAPPSMGPDVDRSTRNARRHGDVPW